MPQSNGNKSSSLQHIGSYGLDQPDGYIGAFLHATTSSSAGR